ncbi:MAG: hypothetical protein HUJ71_00190, partial [Pseudobutyrivibrio sp.]|nr:hypothetical protein [Pseudobutyrivibrio sp.]
KEAATSENPSLSSDASIAAIFVKDVQATKTGDKTFEVVLPEGVKLADVTSADIRVRASYGKATVTPAKYNKTNGETAILVTAEDGTKATYTLMVKEAATTETPAQSSDNTIGTIFVKNVRATKTGDTTYEVVLPEGVALADVAKEDISVRASKPTAKVTSPMYNKTTGVATIVVTAEDGKMAVYTLTVKEASGTVTPSLSSDATIAGVLVKGVIAEKVADTVYSATLPEGVKLTDITAANFSIRTKSAKANVGEIRYNASTGSAAVIITAEDGTSLVYKINVKQAQVVDPSLSSDATVGIILVKGVSAVKTGDTTYSLTLPAGVKKDEIKESEILVKASNNKATVISPRYNSATGKATIVIKAENGTMISYTVEFVEQ